VRLAARQKAHRPGHAPALGLRAGRVGSPGAQTNSKREMAIMSRHTRRTRILPKVEALEGRCTPTLTLNPDGMTVHDSATNMNWLANANLAGTINRDGTRNTFCVQDINADGSMTWKQAQWWVYGMNHCPNPDGTVGYLHHTDWTLPDNPPDNFQGGGFDQATSDMHELFYNEFGGHAGESVSDIFQANPHLNKLFQNFQPYLYWDNKPVPPGGGEFSFGNGYQGSEIDINVLYVIPEYPDTPPSGSPDLKPVDAMPPGSVAARPSLVPTDNGRIIHDTALDIYWLADADLAATKTFGIPQGINPDPKNSAIININPDGSMSFNTAVAWIAAMNKADYLGHDNWRLPIANETEASYYITGAGVGDDFQGSELGELYYTELAGQAGSNILRTHDAEAKLFHNFQPYLYWAGTHTHHNKDGNGHSTFSFGNGFQGGNFDNNEMYVIPVFDGTRTVTKSGDDGTVGTLRSVIGAAHAGDTIDFSPQLAGQTIIVQSPIDINVDLAGQTEPNDGYENEVLDIQGPGAGTLTISGNNTTGIFQIGPYPSDKAVAGMTATRISGLTLENGQSEMGGAILAQDASLILVGDVFNSNQAVGLPGEDGLGGAVAILGKDNPGMSVFLTDCQFSNDTALGGAGKVDNSGNESNGGSGKGGALYVDAGNSTSLLLVVLDTSFTNDAAVGGNGVNADASAGISATDGGSGFGGAVFLTTEATGVPTVALLAACSFSGCSAIGGSGGQAGAGLPGGHNGAGYGGGLYVGPGVTAYDFLLSFCDNHADIGPDYYGILRPIRL
jgi:hypothetical protein